MEPTGTLIVYTRCLCIMLMLPPAICFSKMRQTAAMRLPPISKSMSLRLKTRTNLIPRLQISMSVRGNLSASAFSYSQIKSLKLTGAFEDRSWSAVFLWRAIYICQTPLSCTESAKNFTEHTGMRNLSCKGSEVMIKAGDLVLRSLLEMKHALRA